MFNSAAAVVGPHDAGLANLFVCAENTALVEVGFDSSNIMGLDEMYFQLSMGHICDAG